MAERLITLGNIFVVFLITAGMYTLINGYISAKNSKMMEAELAKVTLKELAKNKKKGKIEFPEIREIPNVKFKGLLITAYTTYFVSIFLILLFLGGN
jgi:hypothetical protein